MHLNPLNLILQRIPANILDLLYLLAGILSCLILSEQAETFDLGIGCLLTHSLWLFNLIIMFFSCFPVGLIEVIICQYNLHKNTMTLMMLAILRRIELNSG